MDVETLADQLKKDYNVTLTVHDVDLFWQIVDAVGLAKRAALGNATRNDTYTELCKEIIAAYKKRNVRDCEQKLSDLLELGIISVQAISSNITSPFNVSESSCTNKNVSDKNTVKKRLGEADDPVSFYCDCDEKSKNSKWYYSTDKLNNRIKICYVCGGFMSFALPSQTREEDDDDDEEEEEDKKDDCGGGKCFSGPTRRNKKEQHFKDDEEEEEDEEDDEESDKGYYYSSDAYSDDYDREYEYEGLNSDEFYEQDTTPELSPPTSSGGVASSALSRNRRSSNKGVVVSTGLNRSSMTAAWDKGVKGSPKNSNTSGRYNCREDDDDDCTDDEIDDVTNPLQLTYADLKRMFRRVKRQQ